MVEPRTLDRGGTAIACRLRFALAIAALAVVCAVVETPPLAQAAEEGAISGTVTTLVGGDPIPYAAVCAVPAIAGTNYSDCRLGHAPGSGYTNEHGKYTVTGLSPGEYKMFFDGEAGGPVEKPYAGQWYTHEPSFAKATAVTVNPSETTTEINVSLEAAATVEGKVTSAATGGPLGVVIFPIEEPEAGVYETLGFALANEHGEYSYTGFGHHNSYVQFSNFVEGVGRTCPLGHQACQPFYAQQFFNSAATLAIATPLVLSPGETATEINAVLPAGGVVTGRVTTASIEHTPIEWAYVCASPAPNQSPQGYTNKACAYTNGNGEYTITGLSTLRYVVEFSGEICPNEFPCTKSWLPQNYDNESTEHQPTLVSVATATTTAGIDAGLFEPSPKTPSNTAPPVLSGTTAVGDTLTCSEGAWANAPTGLTYVWLANGTAIAQQTRSTYTVSSAEQGTSISCEVTASNGAGSISATSNALQVPAALPLMPVIGLTAPTPGITEPTPGIAVAEAGAKVTRRRATLVLHCTGDGACSGVAELVAPVLKRRFVKRHGKRVVVTHTVDKVIGKASFSLAAGATETVQVQLDRKGRALVRKAGKPGVEVRVAGTGITAGTVVLKQAS